jgi:non-canonical (house-cleaning) NTP pyrophosphatase
MGDEETLQGARNRVRNARAMLPGADFYCGLEGGCAFVGEVRALCNYTYIQYELLAGSWVASGLL